MRPVFVALLAIAAVSGAAWSSALAADRLWPQRPVRVDDDRFPPRDLVIRSKTQPDYPQTEAACNSRGGRWQPTGASGRFGCQLATSDAGQACYDSRNCEGLCEAPHDVPRGSHGAGRCTAQKVVFGCHNIVSAWRAWDICFD